MKKNIEFCIAARLNIGTENARMALMAQKGRIFNKIISYVFPTGF